MVALDFTIYVGKSRHDKSWRGVDFTWPLLVERLSNTQRTHETVAEYSSMKKSRRDEIKDVGGFVGGDLSGGRRLSRTVVSRSLLTLDLDSIHISADDFWDSFTMVFEEAAILYSTHSHTPQKPSLRLVMPFDRAVRPDEYEAICRRIAGILDIELFDPTTFQPERLMYWPSTPKDGQYYFKVQEGKPIDADEVLATYRDWRDTSLWPLSSKISKIIEKSLKQQGDPLLKPGIVGAYCRTYDIHEAIETYLNHIYEPCFDDRYTFVEGSTSAGVVTYNDKFSYSHHSTDPTCGMLCNAFDLVRVHLYGDLDENTSEHTPINKRPSYKAMEERCQADPKVKKVIIEEHTQKAIADFADIDHIDPQSFYDENQDWLSELEVDKRGAIVTSIPNIKMILENDSNIKGRIGTNLFSRKPCVIQKLPWDQPGFTYPREWEDDDLSSLKNYLCTGIYRLTTARGVEDLLADIRRDNAFHPIKDYLGGLSWDGTSRLDTILVDYLGAEDCDYVRAVSRKTFVAAVKRIYQPGCKFDYVLTTVGQEGAGKSTLAEKLGMQWHTGSFSFNDVMRNVDKAIERIQGYWIVEIPELSGLNKAQAEEVKQFIGNTYDNSRKAYGKETLNKPRQNIFIGTSNDYSFLRNNYGNRRFWPVPIRVNEASLNVHTMSEYVIGQIWAEAKFYYEQGEPVFLDERLEAEARLRQRAHTEEDPRVSKIVEYLDRKLPSDWYSLSKWDKQNFLDSNDEGVMVRTRVTVPEIWVECFGFRDSDMTTNNTKEFHKIMSHMPNWKLSEAKVKIKGVGVAKGYIRSES